MTRAAVPQTIPDALALIRLTRCANCGHDLDVHDRGTCWKRPAETRDDVEIPAKACWCPGWGAATADAVSAHFAMYDLLEEADR